MSHPATHFRLWKAYGAGVRQSQNANVLNPVLTGQPVQRRNISGPIVRDNLVDRSLSARDLFEELDGRERLDAILGGERVIGLSISVNVSNNISKTSNVLNSLKTLISLEKYGLETA